MQERSAARELPLLRAAEELALQAAEALQLVAARVTQALPLLLVAAVA